MALSIITPHYNNPKGLELIYSQLVRQTIDKWEWIIIDDCSLKSNKVLVEELFSKVTDDRVNLFFNEEKTNASNCRNLGISYSSNSNLVFLDSDDSVSKNFVENRLISVKDFVVFKNMLVVNELDEEIISTPKETDYLNCFLNAKFIWQTTAILWQKSFLKKIGGFDEKLERLQDIELVIRALFSSNNFEVKNNTIDFYYNLIPLRKRQNMVIPVCKSINYFIKKTNRIYDLNSFQKKSLRAYYFMGVRYLERSNNRSNAVYLRPLIRIFYKNQCFDYMDCIIANVLLFFFQNRLISHAMFLKANRHFFKSNPLK